ncbi:Spy/CpxP family protein refolding chaperone [Dankookia rubra]|nr:Spy/CpxP family protein refolding chaperone [Dankookia rubra]
MPRKPPTLTAVALAVIVPLLPFEAAAADRDAPVRFAMMDMMPMGGAAPGAAPMPGMAPSGAMEDDMMRMGGGTPGQAQPQMPMGQGQQPMTGCDMMAMMRDIMRRGSGQQGMAPMPGGAMPDGSMSGGAQPMGSSAARLEGRIAFLRTELRITETQAPAWDAFANTLRAGREHLDAARAALQDSSRAVDPMARLASFESHLRERTEAIHMTRMAFDTLYRQLDDAQKRTAAATMLPFIGAF